MPRRLVAILLLAYQAVFLNAFLPGHTRGAITLNANSATPTLQGAPASCCAPRPTSHDSKHTPTPTPADRAGCAVCHLATHYTPPPTTDLQPQPLALTQVLPPAAPELATPRALPLPYHGRAPPASA